MFDKLCYFNKIFYYNIVVWASRGSLEFRDDGIMGRNHYYVVDYRSFLSR